MTPEKLAALKALQLLVANGFTLTREQQFSLDALRRELAMAPEVADNPATLFTDESSRPLLDGGNYNDTLHRMTCDELGAILERVGRVGFEVAVAAVLKR